MAEKFLKIRIFGVATDLQIDFLNEDIHVIADIHIDVQTNAVRNSSYQIQKCSFTEFMIEDPI